MVAVRCMSSYLAEAKKVSELIQSVWAMETVQQTLDRRSMSRIDILERADNDQFICRGEWLERAT